MIDLTTPMRGPVDVTADALVPRFTGGAYDDGIVRRFAVALVQMAGEFGLTASIIAGQIAKETGWFRFGGDVPPEAYNLAGLGATGGGVAGLRYPDIETGVRAVLTHHLTYCYGDVARWPPGLAQYQSLDERYDAVLSTGRAGTVQVLGDYTNGNWAYSPQYPVGSLENGYAAGIAQLANSIIGGSAPVGTLMDALNIIDIRDGMAKAPGQGAGYKSPKNGVIIHYNGPPTHDPALDRFISDASFHIGPYLHEYTIAYIYGIGDDDGTNEVPIYLMRDPDDVCWHCGSWPENATYTPIAFTFGEGQAATPRQIARVTQLVNALMQRDGFGVEAVKGHQEVDSTACPGTLMNDFVYPFRNGGLSVSDYVTFKQTGHGIGGGFRAFFEHNGGVPIFGYPVTEELQEKGTDGVLRTVQYFERNRFEYHPENAAPNDVQLTRYGALAAAAAGHTGAGIP